MYEILYISVGELCVLKFLFLIRSRQNYVLTKCKLVLFINFLLELQSEAYFNNKSSSLYCFSFMADSIY